MLFSSQDSAQLNSRRRFGNSLFMRMTKLKILQLLAPLRSVLFQYDLSASQFSPDGRIFQVEYAQKAVENSG